jgi:DNA-binding CsgD family transcriptional regulator
MSIFDRRDRPADEELADLIGGIYDAALGDSAWPSILARLAARLGGDSIVLNHSGLRGSEGGIVTVGIDPAWLSPYDAHFRAINPLLPPIRLLTRGSTVFTDRMLLPRPVLDRSEFYNDFLAPQDLHSTLGLATGDPPSQPALVALWRSRHRPPWDDREIRLLRRLGLHLGRALRIDRHLAAEARHRAALAATMITPLSLRERHCLAWIARGATSRIAAGELGLSVLTVDDYIASAMAKLGAVTRAEAVALALMLGPLDL